jgi:hypothetical protein
MSLGTARRNCCLLAGSRKPTEPLPCRRQMDRPRIRLEGAEPT